MQELAVRVQVIPGQVAAPVHVPRPVALGPAVVLVVARHVGLEVERQVLDAGAAERVGHVLHPRALGVPERHRPHAEIFIKGLHGEFA